MRLIEFTTGQGELAEQSFVDADQIFLLRGRPDEDVTIVHLHGGDRLVVQGNVQAAAALLRDDDAAPVEIPEDIADCLRTEGLRLAIFRLESFYSQHGSRYGAKRLREFRGVLDATLKEVRAGAFDPDELPPDV